MKNADMPAMPLFNNNGSPVHHSSAGMENHGVMAGLTKREMMAMHIMTGIASGNSIIVTCSMGAGYAVSLADQLLAELDRTSK